MRLIMNDEKYFHIPYYEWQTKLETNCKWSSDDVEKMFGELMEQYTKRQEADEKIEDEVMKRLGDIAKSPVFEKLDVPDLIRIIHGYQDKVMNLEKRLIRENELSDKYYLILVDNPNTKLLADQILIDHVGVMK